MRAYSYSPSTYKKSAIRSLIYRACRICSNKELFENSYLEIKSMFISNGYHPSYIEKIKNQILTKWQDPKGRSQQENVFWQLPYKKSQEEFGRKTCMFINRLLKDNTISIAYNTQKTSSFFPNKDQVAQNLLSHLVYQYDCGRCHMRYIGETKRHFVTRMDEHITGKNSNATEVSSHNHSPDYSNFKILFRTRFTKTAEALLIKAAPQELLLNEMEKQIPILVF